MDQSVEVRLRCLEAAIMRDDTAVHALLYADLYAAWVHKDRDEMDRLADMLRAVERAEEQPVAQAEPKPSASAQPADSPLPADFDLTRQTIRGTSTVLPRE